jgi:PAS domain S-box-containing protein
MRHASSRPPVDATGETRDAREERMRIMSIPVDLTRLYEKMVQESSDAILFADREGIVRIWNAGAELMLGFSATEAIGQSLDLIIPENLRGRHWEGYYRVMETGETKYQTGLLSSPGQRKDGSRISLEFSMTVVRGEQGEIVGCSAILRDVTARWHKEKELKERLKRLEEP